MQHIIITGASGLVATELTIRLLQETDAHLYLISTHVEKIKERYKGYEDRVDCFTLQTFAEYSFTASIRYNYCIHTAFARSSIGNELVGSIEYLCALINILKRIEIGVFVNISSQSVYGVSSEPLWKENTVVDPNYMYALGKCFTEILIKQLFEDVGIKWTNIRLCSVMENARFVKIFVENALEGKSIVLTAPEQQCSFVDITDVADALLAFMNKAEQIDLMPIYNLGANIICTIAEIANMVKYIGETQFGISKVDIIEKYSENKNRVGMDASLFMDTFDWKPKKDMSGMIEEMFEYIKNPDKKKYSVSFSIVY